MRNRRFARQHTKILILLANPIGTSQLRLDEEVRDIKEGLQRSKYREQFEVDQRWALRIRDLRRALLDCDPQLLHFSGHGDVEGILVEDKQGFATLIPSNALAGLFKLHRNRIECVILSACYSDYQAEAINKHIKYVIGMPQEIKDKAALEFAVGFYDAMGAGKTVGEAFEFGCNAIHQYWPEIPEYIYPRLHINRRARVKKKKYSPTSFILATLLLAAFLAGLQLRTKPGRKVTPQVKPQKTVTIGTSEENRERGTQESTREDEIYVYVTDTGKKYHREHCSYLKSSKKRISLREAKERGYTPCSRCIPP